MLFKKKRYSVVLRAIAVILIHAFSLSNIALSSQDSADFLPKRISKMNLAIWAGPERDCPERMRRDAYRKLFENELALAYGGKGAWDKILVGLAKKIGFSTVSSVRLTIQEIWSEFIKTNKELVSKGNALIQNDLKSDEVISEETINRLRKAIQQFVFPKELELFIQARTEELKGRVIDRSSGRWEDSFLRNLAGIFISPKRRNERLVVQGVKEIFDNAINRIWISQNSANAIEGIPNTLSPEEGFGVVVQPFISFDASGTAMSNLYGHTAIEAVVGDADTAVRSIHANVAQFLFRKSQDPQTAEFEYNPTFLTTPYEFRVKGKGYCVAENLNEMQQVISRYPRINGNFSPISTEHARELNRVTNALENEIGVPLDIEWGILNGELYIIQIRPIIGDFKKPLVEISPTLKEKTAIAQTPIALGHTQAEGFTGKMVLFSTGVSQEKITRFEQEFGEDYIRVQSDVASSVLGRKSQAKVLVDPDQGSRQAHNINLITGRIDSGEFIYTNGPIIKNGLLQNLDFVAYPNFEGIWIAKEQVTCYSDGLKAAFYKRDGKATKLPEDDFANLYTQRLNDVREMMSIPDSQAPFSTDRERVEHILTTFLLHQFNFLMQYAFPDSGQDRDMETFVKEIEDTYMGIDTFVIQVQFLETVLGFPLWPNDWEVSWLGALWRTRQFLSDYKEYVKKAQVEEPKPARAEFRALIYDYHLSEYIAVEQTLAEEEKCNVHRIIGPTHGAPESVDSVQDFIRGTSDHWIDFGDNLRQFSNDVDFILIHLGNKDNASRIDDMVRRVKRKNPEALIIIVGKVPEGLLESLADRGQIVFIYQKDFSCDSVIKMAEQKYEEWQEAQEEKRQQVQQEVKPEYPEKLRVLFVHDSVAKTRDMQRLLEKTFGLQKQEKNYWDGEEFTVFFASDTKDAVKILESLKPESIDYVIADWLLQNDTASDLMIKIQEMGIKRVDIYTAAQGYINHAKNMFPDLDINEFPFPFEENDKEKQLSCFKRERQKQIESYEQALAKWQAAQPKPEYPEKLRVLVIDDDKLYTDSLEAMLDSWFGTDTQYELVYKNDWPSAKQAIEKDKFNLAFIDYGLPEWSGKRKMDREEIYDIARSIDKIVIISGLDEKEIMADEGQLIVPEEKRSDIILITDKIKLNKKISQIIKQARQQQIEAYEQAFTEWEAAQSKAPTKPEEICILFVSDDPDTEFFVNDYFGKIAGTKVKICFNANDAIEYMKSNRVDVLIADYNIPMLQGETSEDTTYSDSNIQAVLTTARETAEANNRNVALVAFSAWFEDYQEKALSEVSDSIQLFRSTEPGLFQKFVEVIKQTQQRLIEDYDRALAQWQATHPEAREKPTTPERETIFIVNNSSQEASDLAEFITEIFGDKFNVVTMDSLFMLERALRKNTPAIVITDMFIDGNDELDNVYQQVIAKNPKASFIVTSEEAAIPRKEFRDKNVMGVVEKPFYFQDVLNVLDGTYGDKAIAAKERFKIEEAGRIVKDVERAHTQDKPGIIKVWEEYAAPRLQKSMLTRIRKETEECPYQVGFDDIDTLVDFACEQAQNKNAVTILPYHKLTNEQRQRLEVAKAQVVYMDFEKDMIFNGNDIVQIGAIIFTGVAYLNNNDNAFVNLYRLLTGKKPQTSITVRQLKEHPELLMFLLKPATIHNYEDLKHLNERMEEVLIAA